VDGRADIFALGCVLFYCLTGRHAFTGDDEMEVLAKILLDEAPRPSELAPELAPELDGLVGRMLAKDPRARPADCAALIAELSSLGAPPSAAPPPRAALGEGEQRLISVVVVGGGGSAPGEATPSGQVTVDDTQPLAEILRPRDAVQAAVAQFGGRL